MNEQLLKRQVLMFYPLGKNSDKPSLLFRTVHSRGGLGEKERAVEIERIPNGEHSFTFCSQIVTIKMNYFYIFIGQ